MKVDTKTDTLKEKQYISKWRDELLKKNDLLCLSYIYDKLMFRNSLKVLRKKNH